MNKEKQNKYILIFLGPSILFVFILRIVPLFYTIGLSFTSLDLLRGIPARYIGFSNYVKMIHDPRFLHAVGVTIIFTISCTFGTLILGIVLALCLNRQFYGQGVFRTLVLLPMFVTPIAVGTIWFIMFDDQIGPINYILESIGLSRPNWLGSPFYPFVAISVSDIWQWTPFVSLLVLAGLQNVDIQLYEAAKVDGATNLKIFWQITLPMIRGVIGVTVILRSMDALRLFDKIYVLTMGGPGISTESVNMLIYKAAFRWFQFGYSSAMVVLLLVPIAGLYWFFSRKLLQPPS